MFNNADLIDEMDHLRKFAYRLTYNVCDAEDLLQSTILRALEKKHLFQTGTNLFSWASKIMFNLFVSDWRRKTRFETQYDPEGYLERESVEPCQDIKMEWQNVEQAMNTISEDHRNILIMVCVQGMQYAEVADHLKIPVGTVRSRLSRARESLQHALDHRSAPHSYQAPKYKNTYGAHAA